MEMRLPYFGLLSRAGNVKRFDREDLCRQGESRKMIGDAFKRVMELQTHYTPRKNDAMDERGNLVEKVTLHS